MSDYDDYDDESGVTEDMVRAVSEGVPVEEILEDVEDGGTAVDLVQMVSPYQIGEGFYASVWEHPQNPALVIKIAGEDNCFEHFAANMPRNPHFPEVSRIYQWDDGTLVAVMERLEPLTASSARSLDFESQIAFVYLTYMSGEAVDSYRNLHVLWDDFPAVVEPVREWFRERTGGLDIANPTGEEDEAFTQAFREGCGGAICEAVFTLLDYQRGTDEFCRMDMHVENAMLRADGTLVFTDPYAYA